MAGALDERLARAAARVRAAAGRLEHSLDQIARTGLDIVDLQVRMEGEGAALAAGLAALGDALQEEPDAAWGGTLQDLEEAAARVAAAIFPAAIEGVRDINRALWQFRPIWHDYGRVLAQEVARRPARLTADQLARVDDTARAVSDAFERVNAPQRAGDGHHRRRCPGARGHPLGSRGAPGRGAARAHVPPTSQAFTAS
ncbi:MAG: hypothetical protein R2712_13795 [Vicinamibacterales bacterium]